MDQTSVTAAGAIDTFLVLLVGIGPKLALVPFVEITASLDPAVKQRVLRKMLTTAFRYPGPACVRYPRGAGTGVAVERALTELPLGRGELVRSARFPDGVRLGI